jgi:TP901 family phage tail tape measure protein
MSDVVIKLSATDAASAVIEKAARSVREFGQTAEALHGAFGALEQIAIGALRQVGVAAVDLAGAGIAALADQLRSSVNVAANFESALYAFEAVAGSALANAGVSFDDVKAKALELGSSTRYSAQQALEAMTELAKGGVAVELVMGEATDATLALAAAARLELANAAEIVAKQLGVWGATGVTAAEVADLLASAANASTVDVEELALGLANVGGSARVAGLTFAETVQTMALIAPSFSSAADAGTSLKTFLQRLIPTTKDATAMMIELGLATEDGKSKFFDATGSFIGMEAAAQLLYEATKDLSEEQKFLAFNTIFGADAIRAAAAIAEAGAVGYTAMGQAMSEAGGAAAAAATMQQGYQFAVEQFNAAVETLQITLGSALLPYLTQLVTSAAGGINAFTAWASSILSSADPLATLAAQIGLVGVTTEGLQQTIASAAAFIWSVWSALSEALGPSTSSAWAAIQSTVQTTLSAVQQLVQFVTSFVMQIWNNHNTEILAFAKRTWDGIMSVVTAAAQLIQAAINALVTAVKFIWSNFGTEIVTIAQFAWNAIKIAVDTALTVIRNLLNAATAALRGDWSGAWEAIKNVAVAVWNAIIASAQNLMQTLSELFNSLYPRLESAFRAAISDAASLGAALINGITSGVQQAANGLARAAADAAWAALDAAKSALGIQSPSRVAAEEVGVPLGQGILTGLTKGLAPLPLLTREAVQQAGNTTTVNVGGITVNAAAGMDERRVAQMVRDELNSLTRLARLGRV